MQIHAFWCMHYPKDPVRVLRYLQELLIPKTHATPQKTSKLTSTINPNSEKNIRMSDFDVEKTLKPEELLSWYKRIIESYTYQLGTPRISPEESAKLIVQRVSAATPIDSFLSLAVGLKNAWISSVPTDTFCESSVPDQASLALWKLSFSELLRSPSGIKCFYDFLASEFSSENLSFLLECRELEKIFYYDAFLQKTISICNEFIVPGAPREINIVHSMRQKIIAHMEEGEAGKSKLPRNIFDDATTSVLRLMSTDSYVRFCSSKLFKGMSKIDINSD